jgi:hypothetical protein
LFSALDGNYPKPHPFSSLSLQSTVPQACTEGAFHTWKEYYKGKKLGTCNNCDISLDNMNTNPYYMCTWCASYICKTCKINHFRDSAYNVTQNSIPWITVSSIARIPVLGAIISSIARIPVLEAMISSLLLLFDISSVELMFCIQPLLSAYRTYKLASRVIKIYFLLVNLHNYIINSKIANYCKVILKDKCYPGLE